MPFQWEDPLAVDVLHFPKSATGNQYALVFMDYMTKWPEDQSALTIAQLLSDRRAAFLSQLMTEVCQVLGVSKINTTAYHPKTDGLVERKTVKRRGSDWDVYFP